METNAPRMCALLVGLPDVIVLAVDDQPGEPIRVHVEQRVERPRCAECETVAWVKDRPVVELVDLPCFGRPARLVLPRAGLLGRVVDRAKTHDWRRRDPRPPGPQARSALPVPPPAHPRG